MDFIKKACIDHEAYTMVQLFNTNNTLLYSILNTSKNSSKLVQQLTR